MLARLQRAVIANTHVFEVLIPALRVCLLGRFPDILLEGAAIPVQSEIATRP